MKLGNKKHLFVAAVIAVAVWGSFFFGPTGRQARWMAESQEVLPRVRCVLDSDVRFAGVRAGVSTGCQVLVLGSVRDEQDLRDLQLALASIEFPHGVLSFVRLE